MTEHTVADVRRVAEDLWPVATAEGWDRVGLASGADAAPLRRVLLAVDAVAATVDEALSWGADALFTHHPLMLRGVHTVAEDTAKGALLARLIRGGCALYSAHTNADQPEGGVSAVIAERLGLREVEAIVPAEAPRSGEVFGIGRVGSLPAPTALYDVAERVATILPATVSGVRVAGDPERRVQRVALLGGAGDSLLDHPAVRAADVYLTSDLRHHPAQESLELSAAAGGPALIDVAHWASESLWLEGAAQHLAARLPGVEFRVSTLRTDPWSFSVGSAPDGGASVGASS
ncbi:MAG: Nif3-like dinuclear metal center hexameric protein [Leucobacter sp.]